MGMFDTLRFLTPREAPRCAEGHPLLELQTKSLECVLDWFYVLRGRVYRVERFVDIDELDTDKTNGRAVWSIRGAKLKLSAITVAPFEPLSATVSAHTSCTSCDPVVVLREKWDWFRRHDAVDDFEPRVDVSIKFTRGQLTRVVPQQVETREDVRRRWRAMGERVLEDDDPIAVAHRKVIRREMGRRHRFV